MCIPCQDTIKLDADFLLNPAERALRQGAKEINSVVLKKRRFYGHFRISFTVPEKMSVLLARLSFAYEFILG